MISNSSSFPFVSGQKTDIAFGDSQVLSPLPIKSLVKRAKSCNQLINKNSSYIDIGGVGGVIFQTQLMWMVFCIGFSLFLLPYSYLGGVEGMYQNSFREVLINGEWQNEFRDQEFYSALFVSFVPFLGLLFIIFKTMFSMRKQLSQTLPVRFHRQRREVLFSRWNEELKKTETRVVPWEHVYAMVGQSRTVSTGGVMSSASLMIAANDEDHYGHFWSALQIGSIDKFYAASVWGDDSRLYGRGAGCHR
ncbi:hypothetical protein [Vibrio ostreae]|uniref:Uncharacterized protein n=1 Tax=Vibrio ostreae TaxID=2841925 RepID=A0A975YLH4_9VIBR|nr:hypothetical protein [Vibrio ostreae]QXO15647.1 hypothetical protein KNV97_04340 [Vibrio ostreae]